MPWEDTDRRRGPDDGSDRLTTSRTARKEARPADTLTRSLILAVLMFAVGEKVCDSPGQSMLEPAPEVLAASVAISVDERPKDPMSTYLDNISAYAAELTRALQCAQQVGPMDLKDFASFQSEALQIDGQQVFTNLLRVFANDPLMLEKLNGYFSAPINMYTPQQKVEIIVAEMQKCSGTILGYKLILSQSLKGSELLSTFFHEFLHAFVQSEKHEKTLVMQEGVTRLLEQYLMDEPLIDESGQYGYYTRMSVRAFFLQLMNPHDLFASYALDDGPEPEQLSASSTDFLEGTSVFEAPLALMEAQNAGSVQERFRYGLTRTVLNITNARPLIVISAYLFQHGFLDQLELQNAVNRAAAFLDPMDPFLMDFEGFLVSKLLPGEFEAALAPLNPAEIKDRGELLTEVGNVLSLVVSPQPLASSMPRP